MSECKKNHIVQMKSHLLKNFLKTFNCYFVDEKSQY